MICALLIFQRTTFDRSLDLISPCLDMQTRDIGDVIADLEAQQHRRFIKTHTPLDGLRYEAAVTYICVGRDPRDVAISWAHFQDNIDLQALFAARERAVGNEDLAAMYRDWEPAPTDPLARFWRWVDDSTEGDVSARQPRLDDASPRHLLGGARAAERRPRPLCGSADAISKARCDASRNGSTSTSTKTASPSSSPRPVSTRCENERTRSCRTPPSGSGRAIERSSTVAATANGKSCSMRQDGVDMPSESSSSHRRDLIEWAHHGPVGVARGRTP